MADSAEFKTLAPLLVGVTGKLDLKGADEAVRAAVDLAFARLDLRCPKTPKILLSGLARGADTVAAEAALARRGWSVIAVLPFSKTLFLEDFEGPSRQRFEALLADPRVSSTELPPLSVSPGGAPFGGSELTLARGGPHPIRDDHYEQVGLYIAERSALLLAVMEAGEQPGRVGGTARIARLRVSGQQDEAARDIVARSAVLVEPPRLTDRHAGPVWVVDLAVAAAGGPRAAARSLLAWARGHGEPVPLGAEWATAASFALPDAIEGLNRNIGRLQPAYWAGLEPHSGDAASEIARLQAVISDVQVTFMNRVRASIWWLAGLSFFAILALEIYVDIHVDPHAHADPRLPGWLLAGYLALVVIAVAMYWRVVSARWQRVAEDYRAVAETFRVQTVWWASGLAGPRDRVDRFYLRGSHGALRQLRALISSLIDGALLRFQTPQSNAGAAEDWARGQLSFFDKRIASRRRQLAVVETLSWFLFAASFSVAACLALTQALGPDVRVRLALVGEWRLVNRWIVISVAAAASVALFLLADSLREAAEKREETNPVTLASNLPTTIIGLFAGLIGSFALATLATLWTFLGEALIGARELLAIVVIMAATAAGASRFVSDKMSWASELTGYERARRHFERCLESLAAITAVGDKAAAERREIILTMGAEALSENENWLHAHRERPLEPIVGG